MDGWYHIWRHLREYLSDDGARGRIRHLVDSGLALVLTDAPNRFRVCPLGFVRLRVVRRQRTGNLSLRGWAELEPTATGKVELRDLAA